MRQVSIRFLLPCGAILFSGIAVQAQIVPDATLGQERSSFTPTGFGVDLINGGAIRGSNLFHSFSQFNIGDTQSVYFLNPVGVQNILTRVTGNTRSTINGTLGVAGSANLFLLNPNGILFGQNARLDIRGSFLATTANAIDFGNQGNFSATNPQTPALLTVQPSALLFSQIQSGQIEARSRLAVPEGQTLSLLGGDVSLNQAELIAPSGNIAIGGLSQSGKITLNESAPVFSGARANIAIANSQITTDGAIGGNISLTANNIEINTNSSILTRTQTDAIIPTEKSRGITIDATGSVAIAQSNVFTISRAVERPSNIRVNARSLLLSGGSLLQTGAIGTSNAGDLLLNIQEDLTFTDGSGAGSLLLQSEAGRAGNLLINTGTLSLLNGSSLGSVSFASTGGKPGNITVQARDRIVLSGKDSEGFGSFIFNPPSASTSKGGAITLQTGSLDLDPGSVVSSGEVGSGDAGDINIEARDRVMINNARLSSAVVDGAIGNGGNIRITADTFSVINGGGVNASNEGEGSAGNIQVNSRAVTIRGQGSIGEPSAIATVLALNPNNLTAPGNGGNIDINADTVDVADGGGILTANVARVGNSGAIAIQARDRLTLSNRAMIATDTSGSGNAGNISLQVGNEISINESAITTTAFSFNNILDFADQTGTSRQRILAVGGITPEIIASLPTAIGNAGTIDVRTGLLRIRGANSGLISISGAGDGGNIRLQLDRGLVLRSGSQITTSAGVLDQGGDGGDIAIKSPFVVAVPRENSRISANAFTGRGGNIAIETRGLYGIAPQSTPPEFRDRPLTTGSEITASSQLGIQGNINITRPEVEPTTGTIELPTTPISGNQIAQTCSRGSRTLGAFVVSGRGSVPSNPISVLDGSVPISQLATLDGSSANRSTVSPVSKSEPTIVEAQGWIRKRDGTVELVALTPETTSSIVAACRTVAP